MTNTDLQTTDLQSDLQPILCANLHSDLHIDLPVDLQNNLHINLQDLQDLQEIYKQICRRYNIGESRQSRKSSLLESSSTSDLFTRKRDGSSCWNR